MEFIKTFREKQQTKRQADIYKQSEDLITVSDFADSLYIAYNGTPLVPIEPEWTTKEIIEKLSIVRANFVNSRMKEAGLTRIAATL